ncbi:MAG: hypothetical protein WAM14_15875 [Candidatus Nitrosopolaris sp.]
MKRKRRCPSCSSHKFCRIASGVWYCRKCSYKVAAGAYDVDTDKLQIPNRNIL